MARQLKIKKIFLDWKKKIKLIRDTGNIFEHKEKNKYKPVRESNFWSNNYIEYESNGDRKKKTLSVKRYLNKIRPDFIKS